MPYNNPARSFKAIAKSVSGEVDVEKGGPGSGRRPGGGSGAPEMTKADHQYNIDRNQELLDHHIKEKVLSENNAANAHAEADKLPKGSKEEKDVRADAQYHETRAAEHDKKIGEHLDKLTEAHRGMHEFNRSHS